MPPPMTPPDLAALKRVRNTIIGSPSSKRALLRSTPSLLPSLLPLVSLSSSSDPAASSSQPSLELRLEAVHILGSLCRDIDCLPYLLSHGTCSALLAALGEQIGSSRSSSTSSTECSDDTPGPPTPTLTTAPAPAPAPAHSLLRSLAKAFSDLVTCMCEAVHGAPYGIGRASYAGREEAYVALEELLTTEGMDRWLPALVPDAPSTSTSAPGTSTSTSTGQGPAALLAAPTAIALLIAALRTTEQKRRVLEWLPRRERLSAAKGKRGWERKEEGGWAVGRLIALLKGGNEKAQIASLRALATFLSSNGALITTIGRFHAPVAQRIYDLSRARSPEVRLAACFALTALLRHRPARPQGLGLRPASDADTPPPSGLLLNVLAGLEGLILEEWGEGAMDRRAGACWCLSSLVMDDRDRAVSASDCGLLRTLAALLRSFPPIDPHDTDDLYEESLSLLALREACMTALASLTLPDPGLRHALAELKPSVLPVVHRSLSHPAPGVRHAACQVVRALSRSVAVLRSSLVDEGVAASVLGLVMREGEVLGEEGLEGVGDEEGLDGDEDDDADVYGLPSKEKAKDGDGDEEMEVEDDLAEERTRARTPKRAAKGDRRVLMAALAALCNFSADFSPVQHLLPEQGALPVLVRFATDPDDALLRMNGIWVLKNLVYRADWGLKKGVMDLMTWGRFTELCRDDDLRVREQALSMVRNLAASRDADVAATVKGIGAGEIAALVEEGMATGNEDVMLNALFVIVNTLPELARSSSPPVTLHHSPAFTSSLLASLSSPTKDLRGAAIRAVHAFLQCGVGKRELREAGVEKRVREMEGLGRWGGRGGGVGLGMGMGMGGSLGRKSVGGLGEMGDGEVETSGEVREIVRKVGAYFDEA